MYSSIKLLKSVVSPSVAFSSVTWVVEESKGMKEPDQAGLAGKHSTRHGCLAAESKGRSDGPRDLGTAASRGFDGVCVVGRVGTDQAQVDDRKAQFEGNAENCVVEHHERDAGGRRLIARQVAVV